MRVAEGRDRERRERRALRRVKTLGLAEAVLFKAESRMGRGSVRICKWEMILSGGQSDLPSPSESVLGLFSPILHVLLLFLLTTTTIAPPAMPSLVLSQSHHKFVPDGREDPLAAALRPPSDESEDARNARLEAEEAARIRSEKIDEEINQERLALKKGPKPVKLLLLGASCRSR